MGFRLKGADAELAHAPVKPKEAATRCGVDRRGDTVLPEATNAAAAFGQW